MLHLNAPALVRVGRQPVRAYHDHRLPINKSHYSSYQMESTILPATAVAEFLDTGFIGVDRCLAAGGGELTLLNATFDRLFRDQMDGSTGHAGLVQIPNVAGAWPTDFEASKLYTSVRAIALQLLAAARAAAMVPGPESEPSFTPAAQVGAIAKPARRGEATPLHQDEAYFDPCYDHSAIRVMCWIALVDTDAASGCLHFTPGSHRRPAEILPHAASPLKTLNPMTGEKITELACTSTDPLDSWSASVPVPLPAGGAAFWLPRTLHGSAPNTSAKPRKALLMWALAEPRPLETPFHRPWRETAFGEHKQTLCKRAYIHDPSCLHDGVLFYAAEPPIEQGNLRTAAATGDQGIGTRTPRAAL